MNNESRTEQQILWPLLPQKSNCPPLPISPILPNKHTLGQVCSFSLARYTKHLLVLWTSAAPRVTELYQEWPWDSSQLQGQNQPLAWMEDEVWGKWTSQSLAACGMPPQRAMFQKEPSHCWAELDGSTHCYGQTSSSFCATWKNLPGITKQQEERFLSISNPFSQRLITR